MSYFQAFVSLEGPNLSREQASNADIILRSDSHCLQCSVLLVSYPDDTLTKQLETVLTKGSLATGSYQSTPGLALAAVLKNSGAVDALKTAGFTPIFDYVNCLHGAAPMQIWVKPLHDADGRSLYTAQITAENQALQERRSAELKRPA